MAGDGFTEWSVGDAASEAAAAAAEGLTDGEEAAVKGVAELEEGY